MVRDNKALQGDVDPIVDQRAIRWQDVSPMPSILVQREAWPRCRQNKGIPLGCCFVVGSWDDYQEFHEMTWNASKLHYYLRVQVTEREESFQILVGKSWDKRLYPSRHDANPYDRHYVLGPSSGGHGVNWTMGRDDRDDCRPGAYFKIVLHYSNQGKLRVAWNKLVVASSFGEQPVMDLQRAAEAAWVAESKEDESAETACVAESKEDESAETAWVAESKEDKLQEDNNDDGDEDEAPVIDDAPVIDSGPPLDLVPNSLEQLLGDERKRQVSKVQRRLRDYELAEVFPREEDALYINRDGYEVFLTTEAMKQVRTKFQKSEAALGLSHQTQPIVIVALMAVHITKEVRLEKFRHTLLSIQEQQKMPHGTELVIGISWYASEPEFCKTLTTLFSEFTSARSPAPSLVAQRKASFEKLLKSRDGPDKGSCDAASNASDPVTVIVQQQQKHSQFQHIALALGAVEDELRRRWCFQAGDENQRSIWCMFGDDDDIWHPCRAACFARSIQEHKLLDGVAAFASAARAEVAPYALTSRRITEEELPKSAAEVETFLSSEWGWRRNTEATCAMWLLNYKQAGEDAASLWTPGELAMEYFDFCVRLRLLHEFYDTTASQVLAHRFCDLRLDMFVITYPFMGREIGLELSWIDPGENWMYFYSNAGIDHDSLLKEVEEDDPEGDGPLAFKDGDGHVSTSFPIRQAEKLLAQQALEQLRPFERGLTQERLTKYLAAYRISLEVNFIRIHTRRIDQRTFDQVVFDSVMASFGTFMDKIWSRSPDLSSRPAQRLFKVCQCFAKALATRYDVSVLWHFPGEYMMPDPRQQVVDQTQLQAEQEMMTDAGTPNQEA